MQTTPAHGSLLQSPVAALHPDAHGVSFVVNAHTPVPAVHEPFDSVRDVFPMHVGAGGLHDFVEPAHTPAPLQTSFSVHATPSTHGVLPGFGAYVQSPFAESQTPIASKQPFGGVLQLIPAHGFGLH